MSVNIFGASKTIGKGSRKGERGIGFQLTVNGDYDIDDKKLTNVAKPISENDAATKSYVDEQDENVRNELKLKMNADRRSLLELTDRNMIHINGRLESIERKYQEVDVTSSLGELRSQIGKIELGIEENVKRIEDAHGAKLQTLNESHANIRDNYVTKEKLVQTIIPMSQRFDELEEQLNVLENSRPKRDISENIDQMFAQQQQKIEFLYNFATQDSKVLSSKLDALFEEVKQIKLGVEENRKHINEIWSMF